VISALTKPNNLVSEDINFPSVINIFLNRQLVNASHYCQFPSYTLEQFTQLLANCFITT